MQSDALDAGADDLYIQNLEHQLTDFEDMLHWFAGMRVSIHYGKRVGVVLPDGRTATGDTIWDAYEELRYDRT